MIHYRGKNGIIPDHRTAVRVDCANVGEDISLGKSRRINQVISFWTTLSKNVRKKIVFISIGNILIGILDLAMLVLIALLTATAFESAGGKSTSQFAFSSNPVNEYLRLSFLGDSNLTKIVFIFILVSSMRIVSIYWLADITLKTLTQESVVKLSRLTELILKDSSRIRVTSTQELIESISRQIHLVYVQFIGSKISMLSEGIYLALILGCLIILDPLTALLLGIILSSGFLVLYLGTYRKARQIGIQIATSTISINSRILEILKVHREIVLSGKGKDIIETLRNPFVMLANARRSQTLLPTLSRFLVEGLIIIFLVSTGGIIFFTTSNSTEAITKILLLLITSSRAIPSILRLQVYVLQSNAAIGESIQVQKLIRTFKSESEEQPQVRSDFDTNLSFTNVSYIFPNQKEAVISNFNLVLEKGQFICISGPSGSGKSTLVDLALGFLKPSRGEIMISGMEPSKAMIQWPGKVAYVPQEIGLIDGSIRFNVALTSDEKIDEVKLAKALSVSCLEDFVSELPDGSITSVGNFERTISYGQKQRLGIARALYTDPQILILDEATNALESKVIHEILNNLKNFSRKGRIVLFVSHQNEVLEMADAIISLR